MIREGVFYGPPHGPHGGGKTQAFGSLVGRKESVGRSMLEVAPRADAEPAVGNGSDCN
jgi:hypothetical protein